ncbi:MAG TPA: PLP-dependent aminotransferase family protein [Thermomicrobiales bacterium]|nr:PLP-dependent aminotransferase family protein [Thermomicrobiales bacterium]
MTNTALAQLVSDRARRAGPARANDPRGSSRMISFYAGFPDPASLPKHDIIEATRVALERDGEWALQYGATQGYPGLIEELLAKLARDQGIRAKPENVLITNGASQALSLIVDLFVDPDDVILSEAPTWMGAVNNFRAAGAVVREIAVDDEGIDVAALERELDVLQNNGLQPKLLYMIPNFQNPTGVTTTLERRNAVVSLAARHGMPIVEDDAYFDLRFSGDTLPTLYELNRDGRVIYMGTFSKIMAAGMRLGWAIADADVISMLAGLKHEGGTSPFAGQVAAEFCSSGTLVEHVVELKALYRSRRDTMLAALKREMPDGAHWTTPDGGFFIWVTLPEQVSASAILPLARERNVEFLAGTGFYFHGAGDNAMRLSYSFADEGQIDEGIGILGQLVREQAAHR